jgi:hypothetical protein
VSEKAKLIRGDPPKIDFKKKGEPPKNMKNALNLCKICKFLRFNFKKFATSTDYLVEN